MSSRQSKWSKYSYQIEEMPDGDFYWKLFFDGERINGGIEISKDRAYDTVTRYIRQNEESRFKRPVKDDSGISAEVYVAEKDDLPSL